MSGIGTIGLGAVARLAFVLAVAAGARNTAAAPVTTNAPIVVTASRAHRTAEEMPANVTILTADAIRDSGAQNVVSALETLGGVFFRHNSDNPGQAEVSMRGFGQNSSGRVLVLVDGQRLNSADMANLDWLRIPVSAVERIEVLRGGQTALYGNYAVAGVINIITHQPSDQPSTTVSTTVGSDNTFAGHVGHAGTVGGTRYTADVDWRTSDGWRDHSGYADTDVRAALSRDWTERLSTTLAAFYSDNQYDMPGYLYRPEMAADPRQSLAFNAQGEATSRTFGGTLSASGTLDADSRIEGDLTASRRSNTSDWPFYGSYSTSTLDSFAVTPRYLRDSDLAGHRNRLLTGADLGLEQLDFHGYDSPARVSQTDASSLSRSHAGLYAQDEFWMTRQVSLALGARGETYRYASDSITNLIDRSSSSSAQRHNQYALDAALLYRPVDDIKLFVRASTLYRDPFVDEMTTLYHYSVPLNSVPMNTGLKPETGRQLEAGGSAVLAKEWSFDLSAYRLDMRDEIAWRAVDSFSGYNDNLEQTRRYGVDSALTWQRRGRGLVAASYNYVDATFSAGDNRGRDVPLVPAHVVTARGEYELPFGLTVLAAVHGVSSQHPGGDNANQDVKLPAYGTLDLGLRYRPRGADGLEVLVGVDNVLDAIYANSALSQLQWGMPPAYYPAPGRTWKVGASYRF
ncbi:MAG: TonB-dependent receptor [bacterium]